MAAALQGEALLIDLDESAPVVPAALQEPAHPMAAAGQVEPGTKGELQRVV